MDPFSERSSRSRHLLTHPAIPNVPAATVALTLGQRVADGVTNHLGSWKFIIIQTALLVVWIAINSMKGTSHWDVYPFIFLNLVLSFQSAYSAPIIMMSQNRMAELEREKQLMIAKIDILAERELKIALHILDHQDRILHAIATHLEVKDCPSPLTTEDIIRLVTTQEELILRDNGELPALQ